jgi:quinol monooxygenase YgiN
MTRFDGYVAHELIEDLDDSGHLLVVSQWASREHADEALREYATIRMLTAQTSSSRVRERAS